MRRMINNFIIVVYPVIRFLLHKLFRWNKELTGAFFE